MKIIAHRGIWTTINQQNTLEAFKRAFDLGFGVETDFRDNETGVIISHDPYNTQYIGLNSFLELCKTYEKKPLVAVNVKADGLSEMLSKTFDHYSLSSFCFDMSVPDMLQYIECSTPVFTRLSDVEQHPVLKNKTQGIWLDCFASDWFCEQKLRSLAQETEKLAIVSPELHKRDYSNFWGLLKKSEIHKYDNVYLCTDFPVKAAFYFDNKV